MSDGRNLLALETSGKSGSVALATIRSDGSLAIEQEALDPAWGSARTLAPAIASLLDRRQLTPRMLHAIALVQGPGSFTGLRVGAASAKTMAWALGIPLVAVDALDCVAHQVACDRVLLDRIVERSMASERERDPENNCIAKLIVVSDAYRGQVFQAEYDWLESGIVIKAPTAIEDVKTLAERCLRSQDQGLILAGPGTRMVHKWFSEHRSTSAHPFVHICQGEESLPMAGTVAELGWRRWERGEIDEIFGFLPKYYRGSAAEEKKNASGFH
jgi:tRNA threonylcarbamoyladenosine biosynthesis protein TsaB